MKFFKPVVIGLLCVSLFFNVRSLSKMEELEHRMMALTSAQTHTNGIVSGHVGTIRNMLDEFKKEQSWMGNIDVSLESADPETGKGVIAFEWQVKELSHGDTVSLHYRKEGQEFQTVPGVQKGSGIFTAQIAVDIAVEPEWMLTVENNNGRSNSGNITRIAEQIAGKYSSRDGSLEFFVSVESGKNIRMSERDIFIPGQFGWHTYGHIDLRVFVNRQNAISVSINDTHMSPGNQKYSIEKAWIRQYSEQTNQLILEKEFLPMEIPNYHRPTRIGSDGLVTIENLTDQELQDRFEVVVVYDNGAEFIQAFYIQE